MKKKLIILVFLSLVLLMTPAALIQGNTTKNITHGELRISENNSGKQDGRFIEKLQWCSPNGELPGTYNDYLTNHPLTPASFSTPDGLKKKDFSQLHRREFSSSGNLKCGR